MESILSEIYLNAPVYSFSFKDIIAGIPAASTQSDRFSISTSTIATWNARIVHFYPNHMHVRRINLMRGNSVPEHTGIYFARCITESRVVDGSDFSAFRA